MECLKCGRETETRHNFCENCLTEMEKYPIPPDEKPSLPKRPAVHPPKKPSKRRLSPEEQNKILRKRVRTLTFSLIACVALLVVFGSFTVKYLLEDHFAIGQNYTAIVSTTAAETTVSTTESE